MNDYISLDDLLEMIDRCNEPAKSFYRCYLVHLMFYHGRRILYDNLIRKVDFNE